jgi:hypothetical protein
VNVALSDRDFQSPISTDLGANTSAVTSVDFLRRGKSWHQEIVDTLCRYLTLPAGWDSYNGKPLRHDTGMFALQVLNAVLGPSIPAPHIVPGSDGGVQIEWHQNQLDIELYIAAPYDCELMVHDLNTGETKEYSLTSDFRALSFALRDLIDYNRHLGPVAHAS